MPGSPYNIGSTTAVAMTVFPAPVGAEGATAVSLPVFSKRPYPSWSAATTYAGIVDSFSKFLRARNKTSGNLILAGEVA